MVPISVASSSSSSASSSDKKPKKDVVISSINPIQDFEALMKDPSLINEAFKVMMTRIESLITDGATSAYYEKAVKCMAVLRKQALLNGESDFYNEFMLMKVKSKFGPQSGGSSLHGEVWDIVQQDKVTLISSSEDSSVTNVSTGDAQRFLSDLDNNKTSVKATPVVAVKAGKHIQIIHILHNNSYYSIGLILFEHI
jgi:hypothetical protein